MYIHISSNYFLIRGISAFYLAELVEARRQGAHLGLLLQGGRVVGGIRRLRQAEGLQPPITQTVWQGTCSQFICHKWQYMYLRKYR